MRKLKLFGLVALLTLVGSGVAVAQERTKASDTDPVVAEFAAERTKVTERTCTGADGEYRIAKERFTGTITSSDPRLAGTIVVHTRSIVNQTTGLGRTTGAVHLKGADGQSKGNAVLSAVNTSRGVLDGVITGRVREAGDKPGGHLVANFRAVFAANGLSFEGDLGGGAAQNTAVVQRFAGCPKAEDGDDSRDGKAKGKARISIKQGEVTALSATSMSVKVGTATVVFDVTERLAKLVEKLDVEVGSKVKIAYVVKGEKTTLLTLRKV